MLSKEDRGRLATEQQRRAANAFVSAWVEASAGTGKTKVLSDRVLRTLLAGVSPSKILCLTYTKAAAVEMSSRISARLARFSVISDDDLHKELLNLLGEMPSAQNEYEKLIAQARRLFAVVLDAPSGLRIQTIHAFCQEVLKRFPLEAKVSPYFEVMDERAAFDAINEVKLKLIQKIESEPLSQTARALAYLIKNAGEAKLGEIMLGITGNRSKLAGLLSMDLDGVLGKIASNLGVDKGLDFVAASHPHQENLMRASSQDFLSLRHLVSSRSLSLPNSTRCSEVLTDNKSTSVDLLLSESLKGEEERLRVAAKFLAEGASSDKGKGLVIARFWEMGDNYEEYKAVFLTGKGEIRKSLATAGVIKACPDIVEVMTNEAIRIIDFEERKKSINLFLSTKAVLILAADLIGGYNFYKKAHSKMDYEDLIIITKGLLENKAVAEWVLYKLDGGIDHVLIDEAQDTSPSQWAIVKHLTEEFFATDGRVRTVFAVGDKKQSIYSFQGADPAEFGKMKEHFAAKDERFCEVRLDVSFRSTTAVLDVVNNLFLEDKVAGVKLDSPHIAFRSGEAGKVELWPLIEPLDGDSADGWYPPVERVSGDSTSSRLAGQIAAKIKQMVSSGEVLKSQGRAVRYKDFLILVQRRNSFVEELVSALKLAEVNVAGVDKIKLLEQIAVQDLLALGRFLLLPTDDLTLATVLKSPLFGLDDDDLFELCYGRGKASVWTRLGDAANMSSGRRSTPSPELQVANKFAATLTSPLKGEEYLRVYNELKELLNMADGVRPFELYSYVLGKKGGRKKFVSRMGVEVEDGLDEFMNLALNFEKEHIPSMQGFVDWMQKGNVEVKRELEQSEADAVRIMTVHGSKGLQAPIVILPDTVRVPQMSRGAKMLWDNELCYYPLSAEDYNVNAQGVHEAEQVKTLEEYYRLLYVALTRAEDRLCVCGYKSKIAASDKCWYGVVKDNLSGIGVEAEGNICYETTQQVEAREGKTAVAKDLSLPKWGWIHEPAASVLPLSRPLAASKLDEEDADVAIVSPIGVKGKNLFRRGQVIHKLLQYLPSAKVGEADLKSVLGGIAADLSEESRETIVGEVLRLLKDERFAKLFGEGSKAEVPLMGLVDGKIISGQIDRLVVLKDEVLIIDYKTNRPAAKELKDVPAVYIKQMAAYKQLVGQIYGGREVRSFILWTDIAELMEV